MPRHYPASNLTPLHPNSLQQVRPKGAPDWTYIINDDIGYVMDGDILRIYKYDAASTDAESLPEIVIPDGNTTGQGRWIQKKFKQVKETEIFPLREMINLQSIRKLENFAGLGTRNLTTLGFVAGDNVWQSGAQIEALASTWLYNGRVMQVYFSNADEDVYITILNEDGTIETAYKKVMEMTNTGFSWVQCATLLNGNVVIAARESTGEIYFTIVDYLGDTVVAKTEIWDTGSSFGRGGVVALNDGGFAIIWGDSGNQRGLFSRFEKDGTVIAQRRVWGDAFTGGNEYPFSCEAIQLYNGNILVAGNDGFTDGYASVLDTDGNEVISYLDLTDFTVDNVKLMPNGNVALAGAWKDVGTGYPAYAILDPKLNFVKAITFVNTETNGNTGVSRFVVLPQEYMVYFWSDGNDGNGKYVVMDYDGTIVSTFEVVFYSSTVNSMDMELTSKGDIMVSWVDGLGDGHRRIYGSQGVKFNKNFEVKVGGSSGGLDIDSERMFLGDTSGVRILVDWNDSQILEMYNVLNQRIFLGTNSDVSIGRWGYNLITMDIADPYNYTHRFWGASLAALLTLYKIDGSLEKMEWGDPAYGMYIRYQFDSDPYFRFMSGASDVWGIFSPQTQQLGNASAGGVLVQCDQFNGGGGQVGIGTNGGGNYNVLQAQTSPQWVRIGDPSGTNIQLNTTDDDFEIQTATAKVQMNIDTDGMQLNSGARVNTIETTLSNDDTHIPTSGAVVDYVATALGFYQPLSLFYATNAKITAKGDGVIIYGPSGQELEIDAATGTFSIHTNGSIHLRLGIGTETSIRCQANAGVWLHYDNNNVAETVSGGFKVSGATGLSLATGPAVNEIETTLTNDDNHIPTSGAVFDALQAAIGNPITVGQDDSNDGGIWLYGSIMTSGGKMRLYNAANNDNNVDYWHVWAGNGGDFIIGPVNNSSFRIAESAGKQISMYHGDSPALVLNTTASGIDIIGLALNSGQVVDTIETTLSNDDTHIPTSGAIFAAIAAIPSPPSSELKEARLGQAFANVAVGAGALNQRGIIVTGNLPLFYEYQGAGNQPSPQPVSAEQAGIEFSPGAGNIGIVTPAMQGSNSGGSIKAGSENCIITASPPSNEAYFAGLVRFDISSESHIFGYHPTNSWTVGPIPWSLTPTEFVGFQSISGAIWILVNDGTQSISYNTGLTFSNGDDYKVVIDSSLNPTFFHNSIQIIPPGVAAISGRSYLFPAFQAGRASGSFWIVTQMSSKVD